MIVFVVMMGTEYRGGGYFRVAARLQNIFLPFFFVFVVIRATKE